VRKTDQGVGEALDHVVDGGQRPKLFALGHNPMVRAGRGGRNIAGRNVRSIASQPIGP
jgi:hypothetical protein